MNQLASIKQSDFADFERQGWEQLSTAYSESWGHVTSAFVPAILASFPELEGKQLIDLATGPGYAASIASREGAIVTGIDFSVNMVVQARMAFPTIIFETADVEALPFGDETIEFSVSNFGFQHFPNPDKALREVLRVLKPRGALGFTVWAEAHRNAASLILEQALNRFAVVPCPIPEGPNYGFLWNDAQLRETLGNAGYDPATITSKLHVIPWILKDSDELFRAEISGSVRSGARLRQETPEVLERIRRAMTEDIETNYNENGSLIIPMAAYVISANKP